MWLKRLRRRSLTNSNSKLMRSQMEAEAGCASTIRGKHLQLGHTAAVLIPPEMRGHVPCGLHHPGAGEDPFLALVQGELRVRRCAKCHDIGICAVGVVREVVESLLLQGVGRDHGLALAPLQSQVRVLLHHGPNLEEYGDFLQSGKESIHNLCARGEGNEGGGMREGGMLSCGK